MSSVLGLEHQRRCPVYLCENNGACSSESQAQASGCNAKYSDSTRVVVLKLVDAGMARFATRLPIDADIDHLRVLLLHVLFHSVKNNLMVCIHNELFLRVEERVDIFNNTDYFGLTTQFVCFYYLLLLCVGEHISIQALLDLVDEAVWFVYARLGKLLVPLADRFLQLFPFIIIIKIAFEDVGDLADYLAVCGHGYLLAQFRWKLTQDSFLETSDHDLVFEDVVEFFCMGGA